MPKGQPISYKLTFTVEKGYTGVLVAQCKEFPAIIVQGKTLSNVAEKAHTALFGYLQAFPDKAKIFLQKYANLTEKAQQKILINEVFQSLEVKTKKRVQQNQTGQLQLITVKK